MDRPPKYSFVPKKRDVISNSNIVLDEIKFYQVALYKNSNSEYHVRRFVIDGDNRIVSVSSTFFDKSRVEKFVDNRRRNSYRVYPVYSLNTVGYPTAADITLARSNILNTDNRYTGYAPYFCS